MSVVIAQRGMASQSQASDQHSRNTAASMHSAHQEIGGPVPDAARQGRHQQRYASTGERLVAGCIPVRITGNRGALDVQVLLISSRAGKGFCFPKGGWEDDETVELAAKRETVEEAGVRGVLEEPMIGTFHFQSGKPGSHETSVHQGRCIAHMYVMHVAEMLDVWPESERQRIWVPLADALRKCRHEWMRQALITWVHRKGWTLPAELTCDVPSSTATTTSPHQHLPSVSCTASGVSFAAADQTPGQPPVSGSSPAESSKAGDVTTFATLATSQFLNPSNSASDMMPDTARGSASVTFASAASLSTEISETSGDCVETARSSLS